MILNNVRDYSIYNITSTSQFDNVLAQLKADNYRKEVKKLFKIIDEIIDGLDMYEQEYARPLKGSKKIMHIHLDGRRTGDIILLYTVNGLDVDLDLKLYNITNHKNLSLQSSPKFTNKQQLHKFDVIANKYSPVQLEYAEQCYLDLIADYKFHQLKGQARSDYSKQYFEDYLNDVECEDPLELDEFLQIIQYFENKYHNSVFGSINFSTPQHVKPITEREESYIFSLFDYYGGYIQDAYIENEIDELGNTYEDMYVKASFESFRDMKLLENELYSLDSIFEIMFSVSLNGLGRYGRTYQFSHYFED